MIKEIKIYEIDKNVAPYYRKYAKNGTKNTTKLIQYKLSALIANSPFKEMYERCTIYYFGKFQIFVENDIITHIRWGDKEDYKKITKENLKALKETYDKLGLNESGDSWQVMKISL